MVGLFEGDEAAADHFLSLLGGVEDLLGLATNPRMLTFMIRWYRGGILTEATLAESSRGRPMTAGRLYELLLTTWLEHEEKRQTLDGSYPALSVRQRLDALSQIALRLWRTGERTVHIAELGEIAEQIDDLARLEMRHGEPPTPSAPARCWCVAAKASSRSSTSRSGSGWWPAGR